MTLALIGLGSLFLGICAAVLAAKRAGVSIRGWLLLVTVPLLAPNLVGEGKLARAIKQQRDLGVTGRPSKRLMKRFDFREERTGSDRLLRLAVPGNKSPLRLFYLHGGAYVFELQEMQWAIAKGLLERVGGEVVAPIYPLGPEFGWRDTQKSVEDAYLDLAREVGAQNIVIFGDSAGGGLALSLGQKLRDENLPQPSSMVLFSPWLDLSASGADQPALDACDPVLSVSFLRESGKLWAGDVSLDDPRVSPLFGRLHDLPPILLFSGTRDVLDSDSLRLAAASPSVEHRHYRNMIHVWPNAPIPEAKQALDEAASFIRRNLPRLKAGR